MRLLAQEQEVSFGVDLQLSCAINVTPRLVKLDSFGGQTGVNSPRRSPGRWDMETGRFPDYMSRPYRLDRKE